MNVGRTEGSRGLVGLRLEYRDSEEVTTTVIVTPTNHDGLSLCLVGATSDASTSSDSGGTPPSNPGPSPVECHLRDPSNLLRDPRGDRKDKSHISTPVHPVHPRVKDTYGEEGVGVPMESTYVPPEKPVSRPVKSERRDLQSDPVRRFRNLSVLETRNVSPSWGSVSDLGTCLHPRSPKPTQDESCHLLDSFRRINRSTEPFSDGVTTTSTNKGHTTRGSK